MQAQTKNDSLSVIDLEWGVIGWMVAMHILALVGLWYFSWVNFAVMFVLYFMTGCIGVTLGFHRVLTHRALKTPKWVERILASCGAFAMQGGPIKWVAQHRMHHSHSDTKYDPHDATQGFWHSHMGWLFIKVEEFDNLDKQRRFARDIYADPYYRWLERLPVLVGMQVLAALILYAIGGIGMALWGVAVRLVVVYHVTWFVNSAAHIWGYRSYEVNDSAKNSWWVGLLAFGEGWHNNHHAYADVAPAGHRWWEFDITYIVIRMMVFFGLASDVKLPPPHVVYDSLVVMPASAVRASSSTGAA